MDAWPAKFTRIGASETQVRPEVVVVGLDLPGLPEPRVVEVELPGVPAPLVDQRAVDVPKDLPLARPQQRVLGDRVGYPDRPPFRVDHHIAEWDQQGTGLAAELALEPYGPRRTGSRLA